MGWDGPMTHRQFDAWCAWRVIDVNTPDRADFYAIQVAYEVRRVFDRTARMNHFVLKFPGGETPVTTRQVKIDRQMQAMESSLVKRGGFTREQVKELVAAARKRLEESDG